MTTSVFAVLLYSVLHSSLNHQLPNNDTGTEPLQSDCTMANQECSTYRNLKLSYIVVASSGVMLLFCTALVAYLVSADCKRRLASEPGSEQLVSFAKKWNRNCLIAGFVGMVLSFIAEAMVLYLYHSDPLLTVVCFVVPVGLIFGSSLVLIANTFPSEG